MDLLWGSRFLSVIFDLDLFSLLILISLLILTAWLLALLFALRFEVGAAISELSAFSQVARDARQFGTLSSKESVETVGRVLKAVANEFFVGVSQASFFSIRIDTAAQAKRLQQSFSLVKDDFVHEFCSRLERAVTIGHAISLLSVCAILIVLLMTFLQHGVTLFAGAQRDFLVVGILLFGFLGTWNYLVCFVMSGFLRTRLAVLNYEIKRMAVRILVLAEKK